MIYSQRSFSYGILIPWQHRDYRTLTALSLWLRPRESGQLSTIISHNRGITITYVYTQARETDQSNWSVVVEYISMFHPNVPPLDTAHGQWVVSRARPFTHSLYARWERVWSNSHSKLVLHCQHNCIHCGQLVLIVREVRFNSFLPAVNSSSKGE